MLKLMVMIRLVVLEFALFEPEFILVPVRILNLSVVLLLSILRIVYAFSIEI